MTKLQTTAPTSQVGATHAPVPATGPDTAHPGSAADPAAALPAPTGGAGTVQRMRAPGGGNIGRSSGRDATEIVARHVKSRTEKPDIYPDRVRVAGNRASWSARFPGYAPQTFTAAIVQEFAHDGSLGHARANPQLWADPEDFAQVERTLRSYTGPIRYSKDGLPLNPMGRTGLAGRGLLGKHGPNFAADPIVTRHDPATGALQMLAVQRGDTGEWAIPGGMVDEGEDVSKTLGREFEEETGLTLDMNDAHTVYQGYADDPRNTDNAWMETTVRHKHLDGETGARMNPRPGPEEKDARWMTLTDDFVAKLYGNHTQFVRAALEQLQG